MGSRAYTVRVAAGPVPPAVLDVDALLARPEIEVLQRGDRATVAAVRLDGDEWVVKRFRERAWKVLLFGSSAGQVWDAAARLHAAGLPVPEMRAVLERRVLGLVRWSCTIARRVQGGSLEEVWAAQSGEARWRLTRAFADYLGRLHGAGFYPQDLRAANLLVASVEPARFVLVDLDRVRRYSSLSWERRKKNIVQVLRSVGRRASATERLRFLRRYLDAPSRGQLRRYASEILTLGQEKDAEYARRRGETPRAPHAREGSP